MNPIRIAAVLYTVLGAGFATGGAMTLVHLAREGELPMTPFGFRSMGGPFENLGWPAFQVLGWSLVGICVLDILAGVWLWQGRGRGAAVGLIATPPALVLAAGFALPVLIIGVPIRVALVLLGRRTLR